MSSEVTWNIHQGYEQETSNLFRGVMSGVDEIDSTDILLCNILPYYQAALVDVNGIYSLGNNLFARIIGIKSLEDFQEKIQGGKVLTKLSTETFVPITTAEQEAMNALHTYRPTTVLTNQQGCQMALTYKTRKGVGGGGNLLDYRKLVNPAYWSALPPSASYYHFHIALKSNTTYRISCTVNNMNINYVTEHPIGFETTFYVGENPGTFENNVKFGHTGNQDSLTEYEFTTTDNPYYFNLYIDDRAFTSENLHIIFDELLPGLKLQEVN